MRDNSIETLSRQWARENFRSGTGERTRLACNASPARTFGASPKSSGNKFAMARRHRQHAGGACAPRIETHDRARYASSKKAWGSASELRPES